jgi:hypothetical protein
LSCRRWSCMCACKLYRWAAPCLHAHRISSQVFTFMSNKSDIIHVALWPHYKLAFAIMDVGMWVCMHACHGQAQNFLCMHAYACDGQAEIFSCMHACM